MLAHIFDNDMRILKSSFIYDAFNTYEFEQNGALCLQLHLLRNKNLPSYLKIEVVPKIMTQYPFLPVSIDLRKRKRQRTVELELTPLS